MPKARFIDLGSAAMTGLKVSRCQICQPNALMIAATRAPIENARTPLRTILRLAGEDA